jgi:hypothetical protein
MISQAAKLWKNQNVALVNQIIETTTTVVPLIIVASSQFGSTLTIPNLNQNLNSAAVIGCKTEREGKEAIFSFSSFHFDRLKKSSHL